jgi:hypothetical protein
VSDAVSITVAAILLWLLALCLIVASGRSVRNGYRPRDNGQGHGDPPRGATGTKASESSDS